MCGLLFCGAAAGSASPRDRQSRPMLPRDDEPIAAIATAPGRGGIGVVRLSGRELGSVIEALCGHRLKPRHATFGPFRDAHGMPIDHGLAIYFPSPHSYTGEDVLELQAHGGPVVLQLLLARCLQAGKSIGLRLAEAGEFTRRAFLNDKLDLAQAEAVADLIDASTEAAARSAARSLAGEFSALVQVLAAQLLELRMLVEATLDFPEEEIDFLERAQASQRVAQTMTALHELQRRAQQGALLREGISVVIAGQPNVGKSSLLNALAGAELAIVTPIPGTTRDRIGQTIQIAGVPLHVVDTAGLRDTDDEVERIGVARSWQEIGAADIVLFLHDPTRRDDAEYQSVEAKIADRLPALPTLHVMSKADLVPNLQPAADEIALSTHTGVGLEALRAALLQHAGWQSHPEGVFIARERHLQALQQATSHLREADQLLHNARPALDLVAEELRLAHAALGEIVGAMSADDMLGAIFSRFCIGK